MKRKTVLLILSIIIGGIAFWLYRILTYQLALNQLNIVKDSCEFNSHKSITFFIDKRAQKTLNEYEITTSQMLEYASEFFNAHDLPLEYAKNNVRVEEWPDNQCQFSNAEFQNDYYCIVKQIAPLVKKAKTINNPDIVVFLTGLKTDDLSGKSFYREQQGNGTLILNLGSPINFYKSDSRLYKAAKKFFRRRFTQLLIHESSHLYDLGHSDDPNSVMKINLDSLGSEKIKFDSESIKQLRKSLKKINTEKETCTAP